MAEKATYIAIVAILIILVCVPVLFHVNVQSPKPQYTQKVIVVGFDGLGDPNLASTETPHFDFLKRSGKYTKASIDPNSKLSGPNWIGMLTGHNSDTSGSGLQNECVAPSVPTLFDEFPSAVYTQWSIIPCYSKNILRLSQDKCSSDFLFDAEKVNATLHGEESFVFVHIDALDCVSHGHGATSSQYKDKLQEIDSTFLPTLIDFVDTHNATLIVSADHGSNMKAKGHSRDTVPLFLYGKGVEAVHLPVVAKNRDVYSYVHFLLGH